MEQPRLGANRLPAQVECPLETCKSTFEVADIAETLPPHIGKDGELCPYGGSGTRPPSFPVRPPAPNFRCNIRPHSR